MRNRVPAILIALLIAHSGGADACSPPSPPSFKDSLDNATSVFIFRLDEATYRVERHGPDVQIGWTEGKITPVQNLYGNPTGFKTIKFHSTWCGDVRLVVGRHYLIATSASGDAIQLAAADRSLYDIEGFYNPKDKKKSLRSHLVRPVVQAIYGAKPLPDNFPPYETASITVNQPPPSLDR